MSLRCTKQYRTTLWRLPIKFLVSIDIDCICCTPFAHSRVRFFVCVYARGSPRPAAFCNALLMQALLNPNGGLRQPVSAAPGKAC
ncbi:hypothetical protein D3C81_1999480 [compost metagenome]